MVFQTKHIERQLNPLIKHLCEQTVEEFRRIFNRKFPDKIHAFESFITAALSVITVIPVPLNPHHSEDLIRDADDRPILRSAIQANIDIIITSDKDFLESSLTTPHIMTAAEFLNF